MKAIGATGEKGFHWWESELKICRNDGVKD